MFTHGGNCLRRDPRDLTSIKESMESKIRRSVMKRTIMAVADVDEVVKSAKGLAKLLEVFMVSRIDLNCEFL